MQISTDVSRVLRVVHLALFKMKEFHPDAGVDTESQSLCKACGLCCSGALFADVELKDESEALTVECLGLEVEVDEGSFQLLQPCRALSGAACKVYDFRPQCCQSFECLLLKDFKAGRRSKIESLKIIHEVRSKLALPDKESTLKTIRALFLGWED